MSTLSTYLETNDRYFLDVPAGRLRLLLTLGGATGLLLAAAALRTLLRALSGRSRDERTEAALQRAEAGLSRLLVGEDASALSAVAVLGRGPAASVQEAGHRLFRAAVLDAWRELEQLRSRPWAERRTEEDRARAEGLAHRVAGLERQDLDVQARAEAYLAHERGARG